MWTEQWQSASSSMELTEIARAVELSLVRRGLTLPSVVIVGADEDDVEGVRLQCYGRYVGVTVGLDDLRGQFTIATPTAEEGAYVSFESDMVRGNWEKTYLVFADVAIALGARPEEVITIPWDSDELTTEVGDAVVACVESALSAGDTSTRETSITRVAAWLVESPHAEAWLGARELQLSAEPSRVVVHAQGAGESFVVQVPVETELSVERLAALKVSLAEDLDSVFAHAIYLRRQGLAPPVDLSRGGRTVLERRVGVHVIAITVLEDAADFRLEIAHALQDYDVDVVRYFSNGTPFWKAAFEKDSSLSDAIETLDDLHLERTWRWTPS